MANPRCYNLYSQNPVASPSKTAWTITSTTAVRPEIYDLIWGFSATPADNALLGQIQRFTAAGTNTARTPNPLDPADPACQMVGGVTNTVEPTYTAGLILASFPLNQRATNRWWADARGPLKMPATANNGLGFLAVHASFTGNLDTTVYANE